MNNILSVANIICHHFLELEEKWAFTGSFNHSLHGIDILPNDIDIITTELGLSKISTLLSQFCIQEAIYKESYYIRSFFGMFEIQDIRIEVMAELENKIKGVWLKHEKWEDNIIWIDNNTHYKIPCLTLNYELEIYQQLGFVERSNMIKRRLEDNWYK